MCIQPRTRVCYRVPFAQSDIEHIPDAQLVRTVGLYVLTSELGKVLWYPASLGYMVVLTLATTSTEISAAAVSVSDVLTTPAF